jgi:hypothetical protein
MNGRLRRPEAALQPDAPPRRPVSRMAARPLAGFSHGAAGGAAAPSP